MSSWIVLNLNHKYNILFHIYIKSVKILCLWLLTATKQCYAKKKKKKKKHAHILYITKYIYIKSRVRKIEGNL